MKTELTEVKSLAIIQEMIATAKRNVSDDGVFYLIWGLCSVGASVGEFMLICFNFEHHFITWPILMTIGGIISGVYGAKQEKNRKVKNHFDDVIAAIWLGYLFYMILCFTAVFKLQNWNLINPLVMTGYAYATFVSSKILKFKPLLYGSIVTFFLSFLAWWSVFELQLLLNSLAIVVAYLIPGYLLFKKSKNESIKPTTA
jgi:hypothetical protein